MQAFCNKSWRSNRSLDLLPTSHFRPMNFLIHGLSFPLLSSEDFEMILLPIVIALPAITLFSINISLTLLPEILESFYKPNNAYQLPCLENCWKISSSIMNRSPYTWNVSQKYGKI